ncbi:hypothetical protein ASE38_14025 [Cellulomonas sp. Root930]|nr:hypothetical protein ASE38_14025 [Cellulomonas sp. Root930]
MGSAKKSTWVGATVFAALVIMAAAWFLAISPTMSAAAEIRDQAEQTVSQNEMLELQLAQLKADFEKLPEYKAELATLQQQIPTDAMLSDYLRQLQQIAAAHAVTLTTITPAPAQLVALAAPAAAPEVTAPAEGTEGEVEPAATDPSAVAAPPVAAGPAGLAAIPFSLTVLGSYDNTNAFLWDLQNATPRLFLVSGVTGTAQKEGEENAGKPATVDGDQELVVTGFTYVLPDASAVPPTVDPNAPPPALPGAVPGKNPLLPIAGH